MKSFMDVENQFEVEDDEEEESCVLYTDKVPHWIENLLGLRDADMGYTPAMSNSQN